MNLRFEIQILGFFVYFEVFETFTLELLKKKRARRAQKDDNDAPAPEELRAIEAYLLSLSKQGENLFF